MRTKWASGRILNRAGMVTPDGMPLVFLSRWKGHTEVERVYGPDLMLAVCEEAARKGWRIIRTTVDAADAGRALLADD